MAAEGQPTWLLVVVAVLAALGGGGGVAALAGSWVSNKLGVKGNELQARADERTAEDRMIGRLEVRLAAEEQARVAAEAALARERDYTEVLRRHIWTGGGWPPPERPKEEP